MFYLSEGLPTIVTDERRGAKQVFERAQAFPRAGGRLVTKASATSIVRSAARQAGCGGWCVGEAVSELEVNGIQCPLY